MLCRYGGWKAKGAAATHLHVHAAQCRRAQLAEVLYLTPLEGLVWDGALAEYVLGASANWSILGWLEMFNS